MMSCGTPQIVNIFDVNVVKREIVSERQIDIGYDIQISFNEGRPIPLIISNKRNVSLATERIQIITNDNKVSGIVTYE